MVRVSYLNEKTTKISEELFTPLKKRRPNGRLLNLDKVLIHSEAVTKGWQAMFSQLRLNLTFSSSLRELVILRIALINKAPYEFAQHEPEALKDFNSCLLNPQHASIGVFFISLKSHAAFSTNKFTNLS